jgi:hypothetical protein
MDNRYDVFVGTRYSGVKVKKVNFYLQLRTGTTYLSNIVRVVVYSRSSYEYLVRNVHFTSYCPFF